jgi:azurin/sugar phosphate isomerase/epimerase
MKRALIALLLSFPMLATADLWDKGNLLAWCVVPFDAKQRGPVERAAMLKDLGFTKLAYDWRAPQVPTFEAEVQALQAADIELAAWWFPQTLDTDAQEILRVIGKYGIHPQLWVTGGGTLLQPGKAQQQRVEEETRRLQPIAAAAAMLGCKVGLYNHGGWFGEPENQLEVIAALEKAGLGNVGIVYNFHHGHAHLPRFGSLLSKMKPHLLAVNLNGMEPDAEARGLKIAPLGRGSQDLALVQALAASGWQGPIGILDHRPETDSAETLRENLAGLAALTAQPSPKALPALVDRGGLALPTAHFPDAKPLVAAEVPWAEHPVNRDRIYDFYAKQALAFAAAKPLPKLLNPYPGLDSGRYGHWGNQNEEVWADTSWADLDAGGLQCGVVKMGMLMPRAACVQLGPLSACFDTDRLCWAGTWTGEKFVKYDSARWGMMGQVQPDGAVSLLKSEAAPPGGSYRGLYRYGSKVLFAYEQEGKSWLVSGLGPPELAGGALSAFTKGGPTQWPQVLESKGEVGPSVAGLVIDTLTLPTTPWKSLWHLTGHDFLPNGDALLCTFEGEVWLVRGIDADLTKLRWKRFASGLSQPLGLKVVEGKAILLCRDQLTRLHDLNGDDEADFYENFSRSFRTPVGGHDYQTGLERDAAGRFYFASQALGVTRVSADGSKSETLATGFRNPNGIGLGTLGEVFCTSQEGDWVGASLLAEITPGGHYGHGGPKAGPLGNLPPRVYFPRGVDNSCGGQVAVDVAGWALPMGELLHLSWGTGRAFHILREDIADSKQGCVVPLPGGFRSGAHRGRFRPADGQLYVTGSTGWGTYTPDAGCFQRLRATTAPLSTPRKHHTQRNGIRLEFAQAISPAALAKAPVFAQQWNYLISPAYGSDEYSLRQPSRAGHDVLEIRSKHLLADGKTLFLEIPQLQPCHQLHLHVGIPELASRDYFLTCHVLGEEFTQFPNYQPIAKEPITPSASQPGFVVAPSPFENATQQPQPSREIAVHTSPGLRFAEKTLRVKAGEALSLTFHNADPIPHNWVLVQPGTADAVAEAADREITSTGAYSRSYVPTTPDVLAWCRLTDANQHTTIHFLAPAVAGKYPYLCSFPGHTKVMRGVLQVDP